ncbi:DNA repair exonuclease, partial [[Ruminococcus] torques]|nr:DNA repair exonuclease [[Ruminococcus] torques]
AAIQWIPFAGREYIHSSVEVERSDTEGRIRKRVKRLINEYGNENIYKITLAGKRDPDIAFEVNHLAVEGCVLEILDETIPAYDFEKLYAENKETLLGRYI